MRNFYLCSECYILAIEKMALNIPHVHILGKNHCKGKLHIVFVSQFNKYGWRCACYYVERYQFPIKMLSS